MLSAAKASIKHHAPHKQSREDLHLAKLSAEQLCHEVNYTGPPFYDEIPTTVPRLFSIFNLDVTLSSELCCPECFALHGPPLSPDHANYKPRCDSMRFLAEETKPKKAQRKKSKQKKESKSDRIIRSPCNAALYKLAHSKKARPARLFHYQTLRTWLAKMIFLPGFEDSLDAPNSRPSPSHPLNMTDIWDGKVWKTFQDDLGRPYTTTSGNLVFGLYCDWFNPHGRGSQRRHSVGCILLVCFNLPPEIRYKQENIFLFGIIPGPREPKLDQMNHLLRPLVNEFQDFFKGIFFTSTPKFPHGREIRAVMWPLMADLVAMRKMSGFASHSAANFCAHCALRKEDIAETDISKWPPRQDHQQHAVAWQDAITLGAQDQIFDEFGLRYTVLSELPYWQPIEFVTVDIMHCILLGILSDHTFSCLALETAGKKLKYKLETDALKGIYGQMRVSYINLLPNL